MRQALIAVFLLVPLQVQADEEADIAACLQVDDRNLQFEGCTRLIEAATLPPVRMARALNNRADARLALGEIDAAVDDLEQALALAPDFFLAQHNLGAALALRGDLAAARAAYDRALTLTPDPENTDFTHAATYQNRAEIRYALQDFGGAVEDATASLALTNGIDDPFTGRITELYLLRGKALSRLGRHDEALADFNTHISLHPDTTEVLLERGYAFSDLGLHHAALGDLEAYNAAEPGDPEGLFQLGYTVGELGDAAREVALLDEALRSGGTDPLIRNNRAVALCTLGRGEEAEADWLAYWEAAPEAADAEQAWLTEMGYYDGPADGTYSEAMRTALGAYAAGECKGP